ncbi:hypothetical protein JTB14_015380 [Gonioctena quinquepunctata]|nr:hypothetical protein JTB14_015380 [Gonioctena quinquepunctata]
MNPSEVPSWDIVPLDICLDLQKYKKGEFNRSIILMEFHRIIDRYSDCHIIYTDRSKTDTGSGCAISSLGICHSWSSPREASVYTTELLRYFTNYRIYRIQHKKFVICTDSLSSVQALQDPFSRDPLVRIILARIHWLRSQNESVTFLWIPSHYGIAGNELVDSAAKEAAQEDIAGICTSEPMISGLI